MLKFLSGTLFRAFSHSPIPSVAQRPILGVFDLGNGRVVGWVTDRDGPLYRDICITVSRKGEGGSVLLGQTAVKSTSRGARLNFEVALAVALDPLDVLRDIIEVKAANRDGTVSQLRLEGAKQVQLINEVLAANQTVQRIDFSKDGNSDQYVRSGFSWAETDGRWAIDKESELALPTPTEPGSYQMGITVRPFLSLPSVPSQYVRCFVNDILVGSSDLNGWHQYHLKYNIPPAALEGNSHLLVRLEHPDGVCPNAADPKAAREISLFVKDLRLYRLSDTDQRSSDRGQSPELEKRAQA